MKNINLKIISLLYGLGVVSIFAVFSGTLIFWLWPVVMPAVFPGLVISGTLGTSLSWWQAVCLSWIAGLLWKTPDTTTHK